MAILFVRFNAVREPAWTGGKYFINRKRDERQDLIICGFCDIDDSIDLYRVFYRWILILVRVAGSSYDSVFFWPMRLSLPANRLTMLD